MINKLKIASLLFLIIIPCISCTEPCRRNKEMVTYSSSYYWENREAILDIASIGYQLYEKKSIIKSFNKNNEVIFITRLYGGQYLKNECVNQECQTMQKLLSSLPKDQYSYFMVKIKPLEGFFKGQANIEISIDQSFSDIPSYCFTYEISKTAFSEYTLNFFDSTFENGTYGKVLESNVLLHLK